MYKFFVNFFFILLFCLNNTKLYVFGSAFTYLDFSALLWLIYIFYTPNAIIPPILKHTLIVFLLYTLFVAPVSYVLGHPFDFIYIIRMTLMFLDSIFLVYFVFNNSFIMKYVKLDLTLFIAVIISFILAYYLERTEFVFTHPKSFYPIAIIILILTPNLTLKDWQIWAAIILTVMGFALEGSRTALLSLSLYLFLNSGSRPVIILFIIGIIPLLLFTDIAQNIYDIAFVQGAVSNDNRTILSTSGIELTNDYLDVLFGIGQKSWISGLYELAIGSYISTEFIEGANPHNIFMEAYIRGGVLFVAMYLYTLRNLIDFNKITLILPAFVPLIFTTSTGHDRFFISWVLAYGIPYIIDFSKKNQGLQQKIND